METFKSTAMSSAEILTPEKIKGSSLSVLPGNGEVKEPFDPAKVLEACRVNPLQEIEVPPTFIEICNTNGNTSPAFTAGNFSLLIGKAKSRKTFLQIAIVAAAVSGKPILQRITGTLPATQNVVILFDTEQSEYHLNRTVRRACKLVGNQNPENFKAYGLRKFTPAERMQLIEYAMYHTQNIGFVAIDGLRDLLTRGINDEEEATTISSKILKWTAELNVHVLLVLHQNKADMNARGHVGTEAVNKAETVLSVTVAKDKEISLVEAEFSRDIPFDVFAFRIDEETGLPVECDLPTDEKRQIKQTNPGQVSDEEHIKTLNNIYRQNPTPTFNELRDAIIYAFNGAFGQTKCRQFITHYITKNWIEKTRNGQKVIYQYKRAIY
jgi:hypothetical protein